MSNQTTLSERLSNSAISRYVEAELARMTENNKKPQVFNKFEFLSFAAGIASIFIIMLSFLNSFLK